MELKMTMKNNPILVAYADDHTAVRKGIIAFITALGGIKVVIEANNGAELIKAMEQAETVPEICIIDIKMPVMNGFETISVLKQKWKNVKVLVLSTFIEELYVLKMIRLGANGYLSKSCDPEEIKAALVSIRNNGMYFSDFFSQKIAVALDNRHIKLPKLTEKELQLLKYCCSDHTYVQIAEMMNTTQKSVEGYRDSLFRKLKVNSRVSLAMFAIKSGIVTVDQGVTPI